jgi:hypothetical protein
VFVREDDGVRFVELAPPSDDEVMAVLRRVVARLERLLRPRLASREADARPLDALGAAQAEAMNSLGTAPPDEGRVRKRAAYLQGFSLHAAVHLNENDREGLAHLCGYFARPPFSQERLSRLPDGRLAYRLKRPLADGRTTLLLQPGELLRLLATLVPPPRAHLLRYHGVFAPASHWHREGVPPPFAAVDRCDPPLCCPRASPQPRRPREIPVASPGPNCCYGSSAKTCSPAPAAAAVWCSAT